MPDRCRLRKASRFRCAEFPGPDAWFPARASACRFRPPDGRSDRSDPAEAAALHQAWRNRAMPAEWRPSAR